MTFDEAMAKWPDGFRLYKREYDGVWIYESDRTGEWRIALDVPT